MKRSGLPILAAAACLAACTEPAQPPKAQTEAAARPEVKADRSEIEARINARRLAQANNPACRANYLFEPRTSIPLSWIASTVSATYSERQVGDYLGIIVNSAFDVEDRPLKGDYFGVAIVYATSEVGSEPVGGVLWSKSLVSADEGVSAKLTTAGPDAQLLMAAYGEGDPCEQTTFLFRLDKDLTFFAGDKPVGKVVFPK